MDSASERDGRPEKATRSLGRGSLQSPQVVLTETLLQREKVGDIRQQGGPGEGSGRSLSPLKTKSFGFLSSSMKWTADGGVATATNLTSKSIFSQTLTPLLFHYCFVSHC